ncbi:MAG TPA: hypothetical protein VLX92_31010 [Kofleriaceae bacterium]|nr:hypothetical protein [Kofleriaceae bacterium]
MWGTSCTFAVLAALALAGCDSRAKASDPAAHAGEKSKEYESCSASFNCQDDLRCFDRTCRRIARSNVGDYFAALGAQRRAAGDVEGAIEAYDRALGHYDSEKVALPPDVDCAYGTALAAGKSRKEHAELAARVLHRCVLAVPVGSALRDRALADLASLADAGLDPLTLGRNQLADVYLSRPVAPALDKLTVAVTASPQPGGKTYALIPDKLSGPDVKPALVACWQAYHNDAHKDVMAVTIGLKVGYIPSEYEDEAGTFVVKLDPPSGLSGPEQAADACVRAAVEPAIKGLALRDAFTTRLTITVK